jgi:hypothetical protein
MLDKTLKNLSVPKEKDVIFVAPDLSKWPSLLADNRLNAEKVMARSKSRNELLRIARNYTIKNTNVCQNDIHENVIVTGHQAIWQHCGIWAKSLTTFKFAKAVNGTGLHLVLDHDICDTAIIWPRQNTNGSFCFERIEIESEQKPIPLEFRPVPPQTHLKNFIDTIIDIQAGQFCSDIWPKYMVSEKNRISHLSNVADVITYFQSMLNVGLGLNMIYLPVSKLSESDAFLNFITSIIADAVNFADSYNNGVSTQFNDVTTNSRGSIQHLAIDKKSGLTELPFWLVLPDGKRASLYVEQEKNHKIRIGTASGGLEDLIYHNGKIHELRSALQRLGYRLRPKAVSLTLFVRLFLADWFVHGVGGASYEPVTDYIIENYYRIKPLRYGVATCTMMLPLPNHLTHNKNNLSQLKHNLHDIKHNPEKYIDKAMLEREPVASLIQTKKERIAQARDRALSISLRKSAWNSLAKINEKLFEYAKDTAGILEKEIAEFEKSLITQDVCSCREYFFGLFPEKELQKLVKSLTFKI